MNRTRAGNPNGVLLTVEQMAEVVNLGTATVRRLAEEAGASRKIGKCYRINRQAFLSFIEKEYA